MRKFFFMAASILLGAVSFAQTQIITSHFESAIADSTLAIYSWDGNMGYVSGSNSHGDLAIVQRFDSIFGITDEGTIDAIYVFIPVKSQNADNPGEFGIGVWENNDGEIGDLIAEVTINLNDLDEEAEEYITVDDTIKGIYNIKVDIDAEIPANQAFFAGVILPTTIADGDTIAVLTTKMGYFSTPNYSGSIDSDGTFNPWSQYSILLASAIFPEVTLGSISDSTSTPGSASVATLLKEDVTVYPIPATNVVNMKFSSNLVESVNILNLNGQFVATALVSDGATQVDVSRLESGLYFYEAIDTNGNVLVTNKFTKQ